MAKTKIKADQHGLYIMGKNRIFRPTNLESTECLEGEEVFAYFNDHYAPTMVQVERPTPCGQYLQVQGWICHGSYRRADNSKMPSDKVWKTDPKTNYDYDPDWLEKLNLLHKKREAQMDVLFAGLEDCDDMDKITETLFSRLLSMGRGETTETPPDTLSAGGFLPLIGLPNKDQQK